MLLLIMVLAVGCRGGAVVFAPTPLPPDLSPLRYEHPSGAFSVVVPRHWPIFTQNATTLAAASFAPPHSDQPLLKFAVANLGDPLDGIDLGEFIHEYQQAIRTDAGRYKEESRQAMGDGSWRISGLRTTPGGATEQVFAHQIQFWMGPGPFLLVQELGNLRLQSAGLQQWMLLLPSVTSRRSDVADTRLPELHEITGEKQGDFKQAA